MAESEEELKRLLMRVKEESEKAGLKLNIQKTKSRLIGKDPDAGKDWGQEKVVTEDEMIGWHHWLDGHEFEQSPGDSEGPKLGMLQSMGSQRVGHNWATEQQQQAEWVSSISATLACRTFCAETVGGKQTQEKPPVLPPFTWGDLLSGLLWKCNQRIYYVPGTQWECSYYEWDL